MTALNFLIQEHQICFAIDSLAVSPDDKSPQVYLTKFIVLPHLSMAVTGTGHGGLVARWMSYVRDRIIAKDIDHLNKYVPAELRSLWKEFQVFHDNTATIYHFGYSETRGRYVGYAYRSVNNWSSEELQDGIGIKPPVVVDLETNFELPEKFIEIMQLQKATDRSLPVGQRVGIGGEVHFVHMTNGTVTISRCYRFPDYEVNYKSMCKNIDVRK
jgi:hypothetical protein